MTRSDVIADKGRWEELPRHIILVIFSHLPLGDRFSTSLVCKKWSDCFDSPYLWKQITLRLEKPEDAERCLTYVAKHGGILRNLKIDLNPREAVNCTNASRVLTNLSRCKERSLERVSVNFTEDNPLFFRGLDILCSLAELFGPPDPNIQFSSFLKVIDLSQMAIAFDDKLIKLLAVNHKDLEIMNMQNKSLTCRVTPQCMEIFVRKCRKLKKLITFYKCLSEQVLFAMAEEDREPLQFLSVVCKMEEKYHRGITNDAWSIVRRKLPDLRVAMHFDHTTDKEQIVKILHPSIPLAELDIRSLSDVHQEIDLAGKYYHSSLESLTVSTPRSDQLEDSLIHLATVSVKIKTLHSYCGLRKNTIESIFHLLPELKEYTLEENDTEDVWLPLIFRGRFAQVDKLKELGLYG